MAIQINEISEKYINKLGKSYFNTVKSSEAALSIRKAVEETAEAAKEEIKEAVKPLQEKIAQQDEFISSQAENNELLQKENKELKQSIKQAKDVIVSKSQTCEEYKAQNGALSITIETLNKKLDDYKHIVKEAYKHNITQEIRDKKKGLASILSGLLHAKGAGVNNEGVNNEIKNRKTVGNPVITTVAKTKAAPDTQTEKNQTIKTKKTEAQSQLKPSILAPKIIEEIETQRKNQKLDKERINNASTLIKMLLEDTPQKDTYSGVQAQFKKTMDKYLGVANSIVNGRYIFENDKYSKIKIGTDEKGNIVLKQRGIGYNKEFKPYEYEIYNHDGSSVEIYDGHSDSYIEFRDKSGKKLLKVCYGDKYSVFIYDKNERLMIAEGIKDGSVEYFSVDFNDVEYIADIERDDGMNVYADNLISKAKRGCEIKEKRYNDTTDIDYINPQGKRTAIEYYINKKKNPTPIFTYLYNPEDEHLEKLISTGDFGLHGKLVDNGYGGIKLR